MLILTEREVAELLDLDRLVDALAVAMRDASAGAASMPPRMAALVKEHEGFLAAMPAYLPSSGALTAKLVTLFPRNAGLGMHTHQAVILAFDSATGAPAALMDGTHITAARTAAGSALATRLLARPDAGVLAVLGTGVQALAHARALPRVRKLREIRIAGRTGAKAQALAARLAGELGLTVRAVASYREALDGADVVAATTHSPDPVVRREWLTPGVHVNSVGFNSAGREVDGPTVRDALLVVETRAAALAPFPSGSSDLRLAIGEGLIEAGHVHAEIGELVAGTRPGRTSREQITLYKSVGVAVQDAAAAALVLEEARRRGIGREVEL
jgi:alanine dehydrogenase